MLTGNLSKGAVKRALAGEPLVDHDGQGILIAGRRGLALKLFGGHVPGGAGDLLRTLRAGSLSNERNAKVTEQQVLAPSQQQGLWFDIAMDHLLLMGIVEGIGEATRPRSP